MGRISRGLKHMWNAFSSDNDQSMVLPGTVGAMYGSGSAPHSARVRVSNERSIISSIYARIAVDVASAEWRHVRVDDQNRYQADIRSSLNDCLAVDPNVDQTPQAFFVDYTLSLFDKGHTVVVPVETTDDPNATGSWDVGQLRVGEIVGWAPRSIRARVYNDAPEKGIREERPFTKRQVAIVYNPFYSIMNEPNSTLQRLLQKLNLLDQVDQQSASGKLDLIIQLPYVIKSEARRKQAEQRAADIEFQLKTNKYGIAYTDGTEKITQLNRAVTNNLPEQVVELRKQLFDELGITPEVLNGSADEKTMLNYYNRTVKPILDALQQEMIRKFLTKTARTQGQTIMYFKNPFELMPLSVLADVADALSRNAIATPNELRQAIGMKPSTDGSADKLGNRNMPDGVTPESLASSATLDGTNAALDEIEAAIDDAFAEFDLEDGEDPNVQVG